MSAATPTGIKEVDKSRRIGRFTLSDFLLRQSINNGIAARLFYGSVPLDVQRNWMEATSAFILWNPSFDEVREGELVPEYIALVENGVITWERVESNAGTAAPMTYEKYQQMIKGGAA